MYNANVALRINQEVQYFFIPTYIKKSTRARKRVWYIFVQIAYNKIWYGTLRKISLLNIN